MMNGKNMHSVDLHESNAVVNGNGSSLSLLCSDNEILATVQVERQGSRFPHTTFQTFQHTRRHRAFCYHYLQRLQNKHASHVVSVI